MGGREPTQAEGKYVNTAQKYPDPESNPGPSSCEATVLTTTPLCRGGVDLISDVDSAFGLTKDISIPVTEAIIKLKKPKIKLSGGLQKY